LISDFCPGNESIFSRVYNVKVEPNETLELRINTEGKFSLLPTYGVTSVTKTATPWPTVKQIETAKHRKSNYFAVTTAHGKKSLAFIYEEINAIKRHLKPTKTSDSIDGELNLASPQKLILIFTCD
jgi:hypothetical protein